MTTPAALPPAASGAFSVAADGGWRFEGALTFDNASDVLERSRALPLPKGGHVDVGGLTAADSSALAVLLAVKRRGASERHKVRVLNLPPSLASLARVYGIEEFIAG